MRISNPSPSNNSIHQEMTKERFSMHHRFHSAQKSVGGLLAALALLLAAPLAAQPPTKVVGGALASQSLRSRQQRSMGLHSGAYGGKKRRSTLAGRRKAWAL